MELPMEAALHTCPTCGYITNTNFLEVKLYIQELDGLYCPRCYAEWISKNITKMEQL